MEEIINNLSVVKNEEFSLEIRIILEDELCLGMFSNQIEREDSLPAMFLHTSACWNRTGHSCSSLPEDSSENEETVCVDTMSQSCTAQYTS